MTAFEQARTVRRLLRAKSVFEYLAKPSQVGGDEVVGLGTLWVVPRRRSSAWCRSGESFGVLSIAAGLSRIFSTLARLRAYSALVLSETKPVSLVR